MAGFHPVVVEVIALEEETPLTTDPGSEGGKGVRQTRQALESEIIGQAGD